MEKSRKEKNEELRTFWKNHIDQWSKTDLSQREYCRQNDLILHRFTYWKMKFKKENLPVEFVQLTPQSLNMAQSGLKLNIGSALQLEIPDGFSQVTFERVLKALNIV